MHKVLLLQYIFIVFYCFVYIPLYRSLLDLYSVPLFPSTSHHIHPYKQCSDTEKPHFPGCPPRVEKPKNRLWTFHVHVRSAHVVEMNSSETRQVDLAKQLPMGIQWAGGFQKGDFMGDLMGI